MVKVITPGAASSWSAASFLRLPATPRIWLVGLDSGATGCPILQELGWEYGQSRQQEAAFQPASGRFWRPAPLWAQVMVPRPPRRAFLLCFSNCIYERTGRACICSWLGSSCNRVRKGCLLLTTKRPARVTPRHWHDCKHRISKLN